MPTNAVNLDMRNNTRALIVILANENKSESEK